MMKAVTIMTTMAINGGLKSTGSLDCVCCCCVDEDDDDVEEEIGVGEGAGEGDMLWRSMTVEVRQEEEGLME